MAIKLTRAKTPEEVGVSSKVVNDFMNAIEAENVNIHSFMVIRHGKVAAECYRAPFTADRPHAMYSVSKTFTATAIGIAEGEGLLSMNDLVKDYFPDYTKDLNDPRLERLTIRHLITMSSGKDPSLLNDKSKCDWIEYFFKCPWYAEPGEKYKYISENIYMLCAILTRVTGMSVRDYLQPRLFEPLGIDYPFWETDANGIEAGGWGLYVKTEDVAKLMLCYQHDGKFRNKQVIPAEFAKAAHEAQTDNSANCYADSNNGYGYCLWICGLPNTYRCDGMFSQFGIVFEDYDALFVMTSAIPPEQEARDFLWRFIPAMFLDETKDNGDTSVPGLKERLQNAVLETPCEKSAVSPLQAKIDGKTIRFNKKIFLNLIGFPMSMLPLAVTYMTTDKAGNIDNVKFTFGDGTLDMYWTEGDESNTVTAGLDGRFVYGEMRLGGIDYKVCCTAKWKADDTLFVQVRPIETIGKRMLDFTFKNNGRVNMKPSSSPSILEIGRSLVLGLGDLTSSQLIIGAAGKAIKLLPPILEPTHRGKMK